MHQAVKAKPPTPTIPINNTPTTERSTLPYARSTIMLRQAAATAGRRLLLAVPQASQSLRRGLATLPTPKFFDYQASCPYMCVYMCLVWPRGVS